MFADLPTIREAQSSGERGTAAQAPPLPPVEMGRLEGDSLFDPAPETGAWEGGHPRISESNLRNSRTPKPQKHTFS